MTQLIISQGFGGQGAAYLQGLSASYNASIIEIAMNDAVNLTGGALLPANWVVTNGTVTVPVYSVSLSLDQDTVLLGVGVPPSGSFQITIPGGVLRRSDGSLYTTPQPMPVTITEPGPTVVLARSVDARALDIVFSKPVQWADAETVANYSIDNGLTVSAVTYVTDMVYRLTTSRQTVGTLYTVTVVNVRDLSGNSI
jgi:hypothetical protein